MPESTTLAPASESRSAAPTVPPVVNARAPVMGPVANNSWVQSAPPALRLSGGQPLKTPMRQRLEKSFGANLGGVRVHGDQQAANKADRLGAKAFTLGPNIVLGSGANADDIGLMAHEAAHTIQQRGGGPLQRFTSISSGDSYEHEAQQASQAAVRGESFTVQQQTSPRPQGFKVLGYDISLPDPLEWLAGKANIIPGFRMFTIILGVNPIDMSAVDRSGANILRAMIEFLPGGSLVTQALDSSGVFEKAGAFVDKQIKSLGMAGSAIKASVTEFITGLSLPGDLLHPVATWERAKRIFTEPIDRIKSFWSGLVDGIVQLVKDAILKPIAKLAEGTEGYNLLKGVLGKDPITDEAVQPSAETLLGPIMKIAGQGEIWAKMQQAKAIPRCWAWFKGVISQLKSFVSRIPGLFISAFKSLTLEDIILIPKAFMKLAKVFGGFIGDFVSWGVNAVWKLLEIVFDVVSPGAWGHIQKTGSALKSILKNPLPFVGNLVKAAKLGFTNFGGNFLDHLKKGLIDWLTGSLEGVYIPKALSLVEFGKLALSILGISWAQIRGKIVKALEPGGETIMRVLEEVFDVVVALVNGGPAAAWEVIKDKLTGLKDTIVQGIIDFVKDAVVTKAIPKLIAMFIPGAGFISAIVSIYDTIKVFIAKISKIIQVVNAFINSIVAIAAGNIGAAAAKVESILGGLLSLAISFLAGFVGLGKVSAKVMEVINKVRGTVDKALDTAVTWIVGQVKRFGGMIKGRDTRTPQEKQRDLDLAVQALKPQIEKMVEGGTSSMMLKVRLAVWKRQYKLSSLTLEGGTVKATINPEATMYSAEEEDIGRMLEPILQAAEAQYLSEKTGPGSPAAAQMAQARADIQSGKPISQPLGADEMIQVQRELVSGTLKPAPLGKNIRGNASTDLTTRGTPTQPGTRVQLRDRGSTTPGEFQSGQGLYVPDAGNYYPSQQFYDERATGRPLAVNRAMGLALTAAPGARPALEQQVRANIFLRDVVEPGRIPTMMAANRVAAGLVATGHASEQEMTTGKMAGATTHESAAAAMRDFQGRTPADKSGTAIKPAALDAATKVRRGSIGVVFLALRDALKGGKKALKKKGGPPLARLATAFRSWLTAALPPPGTPAKPEPEIQRLASQLRSRVVEFMNSQVK